jgi:PIN domain nuclease of toxin-antitoxin system
MSPKLNKVVVDASVVIAYLRREPGWTSLEPHLAGHCLISTVNLTEVIGKLREKGVDHATLEAILEQLGLTVVAFDEAQARRAGELRVATRHLGLSLGDRACLALAAVQGLTALTTDAAWGAFKAAIAVQVVR